MNKIEEFYGKLGQREKIMFLVSLTLVLLALMDRLVLGPIMEQMKVLDGQIWAKQQKVNRNLRILSFKNSIINEYAKYEMYLDPGEKSQEQIVSALLQTIETLARQNEITISNIQPGDVSENPLYKEYLTSIECEGGFKNMLTFMDALEASDFLFRILKYQFAAKSKTGEVIKANIDVSRILIEAESIPGRELPRPPEDEVSEPPAAVDGGNALSPNLGEENAGNVLPSPEGASEGGVGP